MNIFLQIIFKIFLKKDNQLPLPKYVLAIVLILVVFCSTLMPEGLAKNKNTKQRSIEKIFLDIDFNGLRISESFEKIENNTQFIFSYRKSIIDDKKIRDYAMVNSSLADVLRKIGNMANLRFKRINETIHVTKYTGSEDRVKEYIGDVKKIDISGRVTDEQGEGLPGVNIIIKGTTVGTVTDTNGNYNFKVPSDETILVFSFIGFKSQEIKLGNQTVLNVTLEADVKALDEVVVTGYQTINRKLFTGAATNVKMKDIKLEGVVDPSRALQGQVAGVEIENVSGTFGAAPVIRIRGNASINGANKPLWVVDGVVLEDAVELTNEEITSGDLNTVLSSSTVGINPEDIESFEVLRDASATALYGAKAMNGVIVITTKKAKKDISVFSFTSSVAIKSKPTYSQFNTLSSGDEMSVYQELYEKNWLDIGSSNVAEKHGVMSDMFYRIANKKEKWGPFGSINYDFLQRYADANTDWFDILFKNSLSIQNSVSITSGTDKSSYRASIGYFIDEGQTVADKVKNYTGLLRANYYISQKIRLGFSIAGNIRSQNLAASENRKFNAITGKYERNFDFNPFNYALYTSRSITPYKSNGELRFFRKNYAPFNIFHEIDYNTLELKVSDITFQVSFNYKVNKSLHFRTRLQSRWYSSSAEQSIHEISNNAQAYRADAPLIRSQNRFLYSSIETPGIFPISILPHGGIKKDTYNTLTNYFMRNTLEFSPKINERNEFNILVGQELRYNDRKKVYNEIWGYVFEKAGLTIPHTKLPLFLAQRNLATSEYVPTKNRSWGVFANVGYSFQRTYIVNGTFRLDADNRAGKVAGKLRYLPTWNISGAWNIDNMPWFSNVPVVNSLKIKSTYGLSGDNPVNANVDYLLLGKIPLRQQRDERELGILIKELKNDELTFEKLYEWNVGLETALFDYRITVGVDYFHRFSEDLLGLVRTNGVGGVKLKYANIGEMETSGVEVSIKTVNIELGKFKWTTRANVNFMKNLITKWENVATIGSAVSRNGVNIEGYPRGAIFSIPFAGLDPNGVPQYYSYSEEGKKITTQSLNLQTNKNITKYLKYEGSTVPKSYGGLTNIFSYKNLSLSVQLTYRYGSKIRLDDYYIGSEQGSFSDYRSLPGRLINRWSYAGDEKYTKVPAIITPRTLRRLNGKGLNPYELYNKSDERIAHGDFIRLKSVRLEYSLPKTLLNKVNIKSAFISISGYNLGLLYSDHRLHGIDPEFYQTGGVALPITRSYTCTLSIKF